MPFPVRQVLGLMRVGEFMRMREAAAVAGTLRR
jgi:hypothetical protein